MTVNWLQTLLSPAFVTFRERTPVPCTEYPQLRECLVTCDLIGLTASLDQARSLIPDPIYPRTSSKIEEFHSRYGWEDTALSDGSLVRNIPQVWFEDHPDSEERLKDHELFGVSYLVLWLCPFAIEPIRRHFQQQVKQLLRDRDDSPSFSRFRGILHPYSAFLRGDEDLKKYLRCEIIDRLSLLEPVEDELVNAIRQELKQDIDDRYFSNN